MLPAVSTDAQHTLPTVILLVVHHWDEQMNEWDELV